MNILFFKINPKFKGNLTKPPKTYDRLFWLILGLGLFNFILEGVVRRLGFSVIENDAIIHFFHIFVFFTIPSILILGCRKDCFFLHLMGAFIIAFLFYLLSTQKISPYYSALYLLFWFYLFLTLNEDSSSKLENLAISKNNLKQSLILGLVTGLFLAGHLFFTSSLSKTGLTPKYFSLNIILVNFFRELGFNILGMELFFRGFIFNQMFTQYNLPFWQAATISTIFYTIPFLANPLFTSNYVLLISTIFYTLLVGYVFCGLTYYTKNLASSLIANIFITTVRYLII